MNTYYLGSVPVTDELYHHGILGQKWGIRRYQNKDGTLTAEGKKRYSGDYAYRYRDKYGNETDAGKKRSEANLKRFIDSTEIGRNGLRTRESIYKFNENEEKRIRDLFQKSSNKKLHDPKMYEKVMDIWYNALYKDYESDFDSLSNTKEYKQLKELEKKAEDSYEKVKPLYEKYRSTWITNNNPIKKEKAYREYKNSPEYKENKRIQDDISNMDEKLGGMMKMRTMNEIMNTITPEMRDDVYDYLSSQWFYD